MGGRGWRRGRSALAVSTERPCLGTQLGPCDEATINADGRCRDCDIEWYMESCACPACGWLAMDLRPLGIDHHGEPHGDCPLMAL